jgi:hypothetical protein
MENQFSPSDLSVSKITALSNVKEVISVKKSKISIFILSTMIIFTVFFVFLSVYKFDGVVTSHRTQVVSSYNNQVQQMAK